MVRGVVGPDVPVVGSFDLHANVSDADVDTLDAFVGYRTNPHLDMRERGAESAQLLRRLLGGDATHLARIAAADRAADGQPADGQDAPNRPYGEVIDLGQARMREAPYAGRVLNVSVMGGFAFADTPFNGLTRRGHRDRCGCGLGSRAGDRGGRLGAADAIRGRADVAWTMRSIWRRRPPHLTQHR